MKKIIQHLGIIAFIALLMACSNSDKKKSTKQIGTVAFFHYVTGSSTLSLDSESNDRGLGTVEFESFGPGIDLTPKTWDLTVSDIRNAQDASDDEIILDNVDFTVTRNKTLINALIGDYDAKTIELVSLPVAHDEEEGDDDNDGDGIADDKAQYINFSNIHSGLTGPLKIYLVVSSQASAALDTLTPTATLDFKSSSESVRLEENISTYILRIADSTGEIYNSGGRSLKDYENQSIIIAPYAGVVSTGSVITAFYYGDGKSEKWLASNSQGQVRVYNALQDSIDLDFDLTSSAAATINVDANLSFKELSTYQTVSTSAVTYTVIPNYSVDFFDGIGSAINVQDGESWTVIFFGRVDSSGVSSAIKVLEEDNVYSNKATLIFSNVAYIFDEEKRKPFNIHIKAPYEFLDTNSVDIPSLAYGDYGVTTLDAGNTYEIWVTDEANLIIKAGPTSFDVVGGENFHFALIESDLGGTPFQIVKIGETP